MQIDRTRSPDAKARTLSRRTARKVKIARRSAALFLAIAFGPDAAAMTPATGR